MTATSEPRPRVTVIVPAWCSERWLPACLESLDHQTYRDFEILVVDDGSPAGTVVAAAPVEILRLPENRGFAAAVNAGIRHSRSPLIALLNADTRAAPDWLGALVESLDGAPEAVGAVASKMLRMEDPSLVDDAGDELSWYGAACKRGHGEPAERWGEPEEVFSVCAGAALYRRSFFEKVGLFDETFHSYFEDVDLCFRGRLLGYRYLFVPSAEVLHHGQGSGVPRPRYVRLITSNRLATLAKNVPARLLRRHWRSLLWGQTYFLLAYRRPLASLAGYARFLRRSPAIRRQRRQLLAASSLTTDSLDQMLESRFHEPPLRELARRRISRRER